MVKTYSFLIGQSMVPLKHESVVKTYNSYSTPKLSVLGNKNYMYLKVNFFFSIFIDFF